MRAGAPWCWAARHDDPVAAEEGVGLICYLINLDRSPERLAHFAAQARAQGLAFERIPAVDGRLVDAAERQRCLATRFEFQPLNPGEMGVFLSHRAAWTRLVDSGEPRAAVFEDDVALAPDTAAALDALDGPEALCDGPAAADIVKLETTDRPVVLGEPVGMGLARPLPLGHQLRALRSWHGGAAGYVITQACAQHLLQATWPLADPVDQVLFNPMSSISARLQLLQLCPALCIQQNILDRSQTSGVFGTTIDRHQTRGRLLRHGLVIDLKRAWTKHRERRRRRQLAKQPGMSLETVAFGHLSTTTETVALPGRTS